MEAFTSDTLGQACLDEGLLMPDYCIDQLVAAIDATTLVASAA